MRTPVLWFLPSQVVLSSLSSPAEALLSNPGSWPSQNSVLFQGQIWPQVWN